MDKVISTALSDTDRLKELLYQSIKAPGLNPANTFLLLITLLEREFSGDDASKAFVSFIKSPRPNGLEMNPDDLLKIVTDLKHPHERVDDKLRERMKWMRETVSKFIKMEMEPLFEQELGKGKAGPGRGHKTVDNINRLDGTNPTYALKRLKRDRPDLADKVISGELSANAAAIAAGFRKPPSPLKQLRKAWAKATPDERTAFLAEISTKKERAA